MQREPTMTRRCPLLLMAIAVLLPTLRQSANADFQQHTFRATDGAAYQLLTYVQSPGEDPERFRVTTVAGSTGGLGACAVSGGSPGAAVTAVGGALFPIQSLHAFANVLRTTVVGFNDAVTPTFDTTNGGKLTFNTGSGTISVCQNAADCPGGISQPLGSLSIADGSVPPACFADGVSAACDNTNSRKVFAFGIAKTGNVCDTPATVTVNSTICAPAPSDGFDLPSGSAIVLAYVGIASGSAFTVASGGFGIDTDNTNLPGCNGSGEPGDPSPDPGNQVVHAVARVETKDAPVPTLTVPPTRTPTPSVMPTPTRTPTPVPTNNGFAQQHFRAANGTAYQLLTFVQRQGQDTERFRVTSVAGSAGGLGACSTGGTSPGAAVSAVGGALFPIQTLHSFGSIVRTTVVGFNPNGPPPTFDITNAGRLTFETGTGVINVCYSTADCPGGVSEPLVALSAADANVPAACTANGLAAACDGLNTRKAFAFGVPKTSDVCNAAATVTVNSTVCAAKPADGFDLPSGTAIVFVYNGSLVGSSFTVASAGFGIDTDDANVPGCNGSGDPGDPSPDPGEQVVDATSRVDTKGAPAPTRTPTSSRTASITPTPTPTPTATLTLTRTPGGGDCCQCGPIPVCHVPAIGACNPGCSLVLNAACLDASSCATHTPTVTPTQTPTATPTATPPIAVNLGAATGRPGGSACAIGALAGGHDLTASTRNDIGLPTTAFSIATCTINPAIAPGTLVGKTLSRNAIGDGVERMIVSGNTTLIPDGMLYTCEITIAADAAVGSYVLSNSPAAFDADGDEISGVIGAQGQINVTTCTGDCNGDGDVSIGEVITCVTLFLGHPLCDWSGPIATCPIADANLGGTVSIGEAIQCIGRFLHGCP